LAYYLAIMLYIGITNTKNIKNKLSMHLILKVH